MRARAIFEAAADVAKKKIKVKPQVMIPLVGFKKELDLQVEIIHRVAKEVMAEKKVKFDYMVGTMIEVPRGALTADEITQTALGISRDDMGNFLMPCVENEIFKKNPFATLDCGVHGGDPDSVKYCDKLGLNFVSCSPYRIPVARLAAALAAIEEKRAAAKKK